ncbi:MAG TPA: hypothetical protein VNI52_12950 [Sphingobacteriaceae bacterium]|nr:hypothetical protein [Sphingobacteriaceae bacterium]
MDKNIEEKLLEKKINPTAMRLLVLDFMLQQKGALSLTDIEKGLAPADRITIYRSLKSFEEHGLVHSIDDGTGAPKYALCVDDCDTVAHHDLHVHFHLQYLPRDFLSTQYHFADYSFTRRISIRRNESDS